LGYIIINVELNEIRIQIDVQSTGGSFPRGRSPLDFVPNPCTHFCTRSAFVFGFPRTETRRRVSRGRDEPKGFRRTSDTGRVPYEYVPNYQSRASHRHPIASNCHKPVNRRHLTSGNGHDDNDDIVGHTRFTAATIANNIFYESSIS